jgi:hypothetical protein
MVDRELVGRESLLKIPVSSHRQVSSSISFEAMIQH